MMMTIEVFQRFDLVFYFKKVTLLDDASQDETSQKKLQMLKVKSGLRPPENLWGDDEDMMWLLWSQLQQKRMQLKRSYIIDTIRSVRKIKTKVIRKGSVASFLSSLIQVPIWHVISLPRSCWKASRSVFKITAAFYLGLISAVKLAGYCEII